MPSRRWDSRGSGSTEAESSPENPISTTGPELKPDREETVRQELKRILSSRYFRTAGRSSQFLQFVVEHGLEGHPEQLKERTIGTEVFQRPPDYATGDDPVVRVQAGEVRRRLEQFYQTDGTEPEVRIGLPVGSYCPEFHWKSTSIADSFTVAVRDPAAVAVEGPTPATVQDSPLLPVHEVASSGTAEVARWSKRHKTAIGIGAVSLFLVLLFTGLLALRKSHRQGAIEEFWAPVFSTPQPAFICLGKGVTYRPSSELYNFYRTTHPDAFRTEVQRSNDPLPLDPGQTIPWRDMSLFTDYGVATGDVYAAIRISGVLGQLGKATQVRIGSDYTFQDLRNAPSVVIGAFNNRWTMSQMSSLHFAFAEEGGRFFIREQVPNGRRWPLQGEGEAVFPTQPGGRDRSPQTLDYAIVGRLADSKTGQFTIVAAGLTGAGTEAAGEFISSPALLERAFRDAPRNWQKSNSLLVLQTTVIDSAASPPSVVASYYW